MSGRVPLRSGGDGGTPSRGWTGEQDWVGTAPVERLPAVLDPPSGQVVTANAEIDPRWPGVMTRDWTAPFRTMRIAARLAGQTTLDQAALVGDSDGRAVGRCRSHPCRRRGGGQVAAALPRPTATRALASTGFGCGIGKSTAARS